MRIRKMYLGEIKQRAKNMFMEALNGDMFRTEQGECWHADRACASNRTANVVHRLRPCKVRAMRLGRLLMSTPSDEEGLMAGNLETFPDEGSSSEPALPSTGVNVHPHIADSSGSQA